MISPYVAFLAWVPVSLYLFRRFPVRMAVLINFIGGWAVLPSAPFAPTNAGFPYWILGTCLPSIHFFTKASIIAITCLTGVLLTDRQIFQQFKLSFWDLPMLAWCCVPLLSGLANDQGLVSTLRSGLYQILAWGVPYIFGRLYFSDADSRKLAAKAFVIAGMAYVPICLLEILTGPQFYAHLYGCQPYRWVGAQRYFGFRPVGFLEDGNQLGIWMAVSALIAVCLWKWQLIDRVLRVPIAWVAGTLFAFTLLCQSGGSIILLLCLLPLVLFRKSHPSRILTAILFLGILAAMAIRLADVVSLRTLVKQNAAARSAAQFLSKIHRQSFGWRLSQDEKTIKQALVTPLLGTGEWDWWKASSSRPWGLWLLAFGMYGMVGLISLEGLQLLPVARALGPPGLCLDPAAFHMRNALAAVILMSAVDNLLNGSMILPLCLLIGGLSAPFSTGGQRALTTSSNSAGNSTDARPFERSAKIAHPEPRDQALIP
jgi:hypothetical protein